MCGRRQESSGVILNVNIILLDRNVKIAFVRKCEVGTHFSLVSR
jgi:hypothetical protein